MCPCNHKPCTCCACNEPASEPTRQPHKHAALIKAWADGAKIELKSYQGRWLATELPSWDVDREYQIKPVPDRTKYGAVREDRLGHGHLWDNPQSFCNVKVIFDGETGKLKSVSILD